jgi:hypothetical protein
LGVWEGGLGEGEAICAKRNSAERNGAERNGTQKNGFEGNFVSLYTAFFDYFKKKGYLRITERKKSQGLSTLLDIASQNI